MQDTRFYGTYLAGVRVLEFAGELGEYCGKFLAGLGADVVKVEPPVGEVTRRFGPFRNDSKDPEGSLYFWHYNVGKRSISIDFDDPEACNELRGLMLAADVIIDAQPRDVLSSKGLGYGDISGANAGLVWARITPFGDDGPWSHYQANDMVHLALGGVMMNCGYDPDPAGGYDTPPIAPQMQQAYHIVGEMTAMAVLAALNHKIRGGSGQRLDISVHDAVSKNTETDLPDWVYLRQPHFRQTCRHSTMTPTGSSLAKTKDGRWLLAYSTYLKGMDDGWAGTLALLKKYDMQADFADSDYQEQSFRALPHVDMRIRAAVAKLCERLMYDGDLWKEAQDLGLPWAPVRRPEENIGDSHWIARSTFTSVLHEESNTDYNYVWRRWVDDHVSWGAAIAPPRLGEHNGTIKWARHDEPRETTDPGKLSAHGKPFALDGIRVIDLSWIVASAGAGRFLGAYGAEVIKVEHESRWDGMRWGLGNYPDGGRSARDAATGPMRTMDWDSPNRSGAFMELNSGKLGMSLNLKHPDGKHLLERLIQDADVIVEGFSPGTLARMGFTYDRLREINPAIVYVQQSGFGEKGTYGRARAFGPTAQAFSGLSDMSGLPEPFPPAGIGYSYLDWFGAYNVANAILAGLYRRAQTGSGCHIDASQGEVGIYLSGTAVLDWEVNRRSWARSGNSSSVQQSAPHGAFPAMGVDRWVAIACRDETEWLGLVTALGNPDWSSDDRFQTLELRTIHQLELDRHLSAETRTCDAFDLMDRLQSHGVPAGVCQTAQDRYERDPQLSHLGWLVELDQEEMGRWPIKEVPGVLSETPGYIGGRLNRAGPSYSQDTDFVLRNILGCDPAEVDALRKDGVISSSTNSRRV